MKNKKSLNKELLSKRVFFKEDIIRDELFAKLKSRFGNWTKLGKHFNIYKSKLENLRNGTRSIKYSIFLDFLNCFSQEERVLFQQQVIIKDKNWGRSKGGISTYKKHKYIFEKGRKIGAENCKRNPRYKFKFNMPLSLNLCELIGAFIGDGFTNKYGGAYMIQYVGDSRFDKEYITKRLEPIIKEIGPTSNPVVTQKDNTIRLTVYSKELFNLLTKRFKFTAGKKAYTVIIPEEIINSSNQELINRCIRGIFDTDGCVFQDKRKVYKKPYVRINLSSVSSILIDQVYTILSNLDLNPRRSTNYHKNIIQINGVENCKKFVKLIGFSNKRHLDKIKNILN